MADRPRIRESLSLDAEVYEDVRRLLRSASDQGPKLESFGAEESIVDSVLPALDPSVLGESLDVLTNDEVVVPDLDLGIFKDGLPGDMAHVEAIVEEIGRPPLIVVKDKWKDPAIPSLKKRLASAAKRLQACLPAVGRIDLVEGGHENGIGTGWLIEEDIVVTNAHVARRFAKAMTPTNCVFQPPDRVVEFDTKHEDGVADKEEFAVVKPLYIDPDPKMDVAFVRIATSNGRGPTPLELESQEPTEKLDVAAIGYPQYDPRNDTFVMQNYFGSTYGVKRLSPGRLLSVKDPNWIEHDCTTLGGSSGSALVNLSSGKTVGLHFQGDYGERNLALKIKHVKDALTKV